MEKIKIMLENYLSAPHLIKQQKLRWGYFVGTFVGLIILISFFFVSNYIGNSIFDKVNKIFNFQSYTGIVKIVVVVLIRVTLISIQYLFFKTILLGILAPFFSYVSEKIETFETEIKYSFTFKDNLVFIIRGIKIASKSFLKEMLYTLVILFLGFIPLINIFVPILIFIVQSYFISFNFVDYTLERHKFSSKESSEFIWRNKIPFITGGAIFTILYFIPIIGIIVAPILSIVAFTRTTLKFIEHEKILELKKRHLKQ
ncbi:EI24 domain-containing protein [Cetobacterium sp.]|uniref:EI24 domain-containing protein n=1 Tax=Cetobacterium sp. TaxID=2071632 RepID=UPI003F3D1D53